MSARGTPAAEQHTDQEMSKPTPEQPNGSNDFSEVNERDLKQEPAQQSPHPTSIASPAPALARTSRTSTPTHQTPDPSGRAVSTNAETIAAVPLHAVEHGAPFRRYLNSKVTPSLADGLKQLALERPQDPLRFLGQYLLQKSKELEGM